MKYTKHYQLKQWDSADRVLREDFNRDNEKNRRGDHSPAVGMPPE
ncbi:MAG: hypothetical protein SOZ14_09700 [Candidatus Pseudoscilispira sp.]|nr:hypothetical protein [Candidatus Pseudoscilispira sp.]